MVVAGPQCRSTTYTIQPTTPAFEKHRVHMELGKRVFVSKSYVEVILYYALF